MTTVSHLSPGWYHENALRALGITADVTYSAGRVVVSLSDDDLDHLVEMTTEHYRCDGTSVEAVDAAHEAGEEVGREEGYDGALGDIECESGAAWDKVRPMLERAFEDGHQRACEEIAELA